MLTLITPPVANQIIDHVGGSAALATILGESRQRVHNWRARGIPGGAILKHYEVISALHEKVRPKRKRNGNV